MDGRGVVHSGEKADACSEIWPTVLGLVEPTAAIRWEAKRRHSTRRGSWAGWRRVRPGCFLPTDPGPIAVAPTCNLLSRGQGPGRRFFCFRAAELPLAPWKVRPRLRSSGKPRRMERRRRQWDVSPLLTRRAFVSLHGDRARDARDHDDRVVQGERADREPDSGRLERVVHFAENDVIGRHGVGRNTAASGIVIGA
jgi:hypothetical protein